MPKIVDPVERRQAVADAVLRVAAREGLERASLRNVAEEAGLAIGSVRHYFAGSSELMIFAMQELARRIDARIRTHARVLLDPDPGPGTDRREQTVGLLAETLPLDAERREESALWLSFVTAARTRPELLPRAGELQAGLDALVRRVLVEMERSGALLPGLDLDLETRRLSALLDGLTLQGVQHPDLVGPDELRAVLRRHLDTLTTS
ncbi:MULTISPECIES: TetR/AcrR family transcriptional regulator [Kitasatospora]|uniref:TetR family transcriptional regulator C-terminal domain-containing protein n=1 Tax=Kitasatospora cathayae TaxID=3004092 RepID=A0ABY7QBP8_9ACTN|nr:TetR family transcriptional regulator C-terminal domain-containing protein [Kitasatospora sp. HUAS 3-15]WBP90193.1 TetR family transcriptional regulator C-terminal domain-containing protein [Kitasatospora sp. HUAS 3-15]